MNISFIGGGKRVENYCRLFEQRENIEICGFYCNPIKDCTDVAIRTNSCLFTCIDDLCNASDIIFIATDDEAVPWVIKTLSKLHIHGKIIISIAKSIYASDLDNGYPNTYAVIDSPVYSEQLTETEIRDTYFVINGFGENYEYIVDVFSQNGINISDVSKPELELFRVACHLMTYGIKATYESSRKLIKIATGSDKFNINPLVTEAINHFDSSKCIYKNGKIRDIKEIIDTLDNNGIDSISHLYRAIGEVTVDNAATDPDSAEDIYKILRKK